MTSGVRDEFTASCDLKGRMLTLALRCLPGNTTCRKCATALEAHAYLQASNELRQLAADQGVSSLACAGSRTLLLPAEG
jgi:hypothetical protein